MLTVVLIVLGAVVLAVLGLVLWDCCGRPRW